jgi:hypothetical protein
MTTPAPVIPVTWDGLAVNQGYDPASGLTWVIEDVAGWKDSPPLNGNDLDRGLSDGSAYGVKTLEARQVVLQGVVTASAPADLPAARDQLAGKAAARSPAPLVIGDRAGRTMTATVRGDSDAFKWTFLNPAVFRWQVTLTAADPRMFDVTAQTVTLSNTGTTGGWGYFRTYPRTYPAGVLSSTAWLPNAGNVAAPVVALYTGPLASGLRLTDGTNTIFMAALGPAEQVFVQCDRLIAAAPGGASRASYLLAGSAPMSVPPGGAQWSLIGSGSGTVQLQWQAAWT